MTQIQSPPHGPQHNMSPRTAAEDQITSETDAARSFEMMFLSNVLDEMIKTVDLESSMGAHPASMWRSVLSEALAESLVNQGGIGIGKSIDQKIAAYTTRLGDNNE